MDKIESRISKELKESARVIAETEKLSPVLEKF